MRWARRDFAEVVARHQHRDALLSRQLEQQLADLDNARRVQAVGRFVQDEQLRAVQQCFGQAQTLMHCPGKDTGTLVGVGRQTQALDHLTDGPARGAGMQAAGQPPGSRRLSIPHRRAALSTR